MLLQPKFSFLGVLFFATIAFSTEDYSQWRYYRTVTVNTTATGASVSVAQRKFPTLVRLTSANFDFAKAMRTGADVRFAKTNGTHLPYQVEQWDSTGRAAAIWILLDTVVGNGNTAFRMYYGKSGSVDSSKGSAVFDTANGFQGVFHLSEAMNDTVRDATANLFKGVPQNRGGVNPQDTVGLIGKSKNFLGNNSSGNGGSYRLVTSTGGNTFTNNALNFQNDSATKNGLPQYTISTWINVNEYPTGTSNRKGIIAKSRGTNGQQYHLMLYDPNLTNYSPGKDTMRLGFSDGPAAVYKRGDHRLTPWVAYHDTVPYFRTIPSTWQHVVAVRSSPVGTPTNLRVIVDGVFACSSSTSITATTRSDFDVTIGSYSNDSGFFSGKLDEVRFENVVRDSMWIRLNYWTQRPDSNAVTVGSETIVGLNPVNPALKNAMIGSWVIHVKGPKSFSFRLNNKLTATMTVENMDGRIVWSRTTKPDQNGQVFWNGRNENGQPVSPGMYVVRLIPSGGQ